MILLNGENGVESSKEGKLIPKYFSNDVIKKLYFHALAPIFPDNNMKADIVKEIIGPEFIELGLGTNRMAFLYNGMVVSIALDRRGRLMPRL